MLIKLPTKTGHCWVKAENVAAITPTGDKSCHVWISGVTEVVEGSGSSNVSVLLPQDECAERLNDALSGIKRREK